VLAKLGGPQYYNHMAHGWGWAMNTPFKYYKQVVSHLGAIRNPMLVSWPARIKDRGTVRGQFHFLSDIAPTLLEAAKVEIPASVNGIAQKPLDGVSLLYSFADAKAADRRRIQYFEVFGNRSIYQDGWFASAKLTVKPVEQNRDALDPDKVQWELYDLSNDFSQARDIANQQPAKLRAMQDLWWAEAAKNDVLPLDWRLASRKAGPKPGSVAGQQHFVYHPGMVALPEAIAPNIRNRSWRIAARGSFSPAAKGMLITQGGNPGGWAFYVQDGQLVFDYNYAGLEHYRIVSSESLPASVAKLEVRFAYDGKSPQEFGRGGIVALWADGRKVGEGRLPKTLPWMFSLLEGMDVGADYGSPVSDQYPLPFPFANGQLDTVTIDLD
jgi:arylsulfatase